MSPGLNEVRSPAGLALSLLLAGCALDQSVGATEGAPTVTSPRASAGTARAASETPLRARGNEPGWNLTIGDAEIELVTDYGAARSVFPKPAPEIAAGATRYVLADADLTITLLEGPCADTMSGMFHPLTVTVERPEGVLSGCGGEPASLLLGPEWIVESIDGDALIGDSRPTIIFNEEGQVAGLASCNRYLASYELTGEDLSIAGGASTMMACEPALMEQERRFLDALHAIRRFEIAPDGALVLVADARPKLIAPLTRPCAGERLIAIRPDYAFSHRWTLGRIGGSCEPPRCNAPQT